ncbi:hypothetical protein SSX86_017816 [Deinandra increscens subsp. villosa]|uniref:Leucine-rich repeat-containing N-terminal plant-type domain-containing protein n=1 Tax=Deinandra increscens subsp. villosa TaxID=3103831 RepID=A0AAP0GX36_9ASTR
MGYQRVLGLHLIFFSMFLVAATKYTCLGAQNSTVSCHEPERLALLQFKHSVKDDFNVLSSWVGTDCCSWKGVRCDEATGTVVSLRLRGSNKESQMYNYFEDDHYLVSDKLNANLAELRHLKHLDLSGNDFQGSRIPEFIGTLKQLRYLNLSHARFIGIIPHHIGNLSNLKVLDLSSYNQYHFDGVGSYDLMINDMAWFSCLSSLEHLGLSGIGFLQAKNMEMVLYMIPSLTYLSLRDCGLSNFHLGPHLNSSKILPNIKHLDLSFNNFEGRLPRFLQNMTSLTFLDLSSYNLSLAWNSVNVLNMIPSISELHLCACGLHNSHFSPTYLNLSLHSNIKYLDLEENSIGGRFPSELMNITSLTVLDLKFNNINSSIPVMPNLLKLDVSFNNLENIELVGIWRQCQLKELRLSSNYFGGEMIGPSTNTSECSQYALEMLESDDNLLNGAIPESLRRLSNLRVLNLEFNSFKGLIPKALQRLRSLEVLNLYGNDLTGPIPTFHGKLTTLLLGQNQFSGSIPESLGRLTCLTHLTLSSNWLTGPIPASIGRLASLQEFSVSSNMLNGTIPVSLGQLTKLVVLSLSNNSLEGVVSEANFANLTMLKDMDITSNYKLIFNISHEWIPPFQLRFVQLSSCKILDGFPQWLQTQKKLKILELSNTSLRGILPTWLRKMSAISQIYLSHNQLGGSLKNVPNMYRTSGFESKGYFYLQDNLFNGSIPRSLLCRSTNLIELDVSTNRLHGNIPDCVENLQNIRSLILSSNELSGVLPSSLGNASSSLAWLKLNNNNLNGEIPRDIRNLKSLRVLDLGDNKFSGNIPKWIGENLTSLMILRLHKNTFTGTIPQSLCKCSYLHILDVAHNYLTGSIPHCFGELSGMIDASWLDIHNGSSDYNNLNVIQVMKGMNLKYTKTLDLVFNMDLSSNKLVGEIPGEITTLTLLVGINLSHNNLNGSIPHNIGNMKALNSIDFSDNQFSGTIPPSMAALNFLSYMNLSHNNLSGRIPTGSQLQTLTDPSIYAGNRNLCGAPLPNNCSNHENPPTIAGKNRYKDDNEPKNLWFYLDIMCGFATGFWGIIGVLWFKKQWRKKLFMMAQASVDKVYVAVAVKVSKIKRGRETN